MSVSHRSGRFVVLAASVMLALALVGPALAETPTPTATAPPPAAPSPSGTPWPAPTGVTVRVEAILLDANNFPLPPEKQVHTAVVTWELMNGFTGTYEIEHGIAAIRSSAPRKWQLAGTADANAAVDGTLRWEEQVQPLSLSYCYRVRTVINGETGPYSAEACIPEPPSSGPAPLPPGVGNSAALRTSGDGLTLAWLALAAAVFAGGPLVAGWAALRKRGG